MCAERGLHPVIEVDGGENATTAAQAAAAGATAIVAGSAIFGAGITLRLLPTFVRGPSRRP